MSVVAHRGIDRTPPAPCARGSALLVALTVLLAACVLPRDDSGIGGFDRISTAQVAALASIDGDGNLTIVEQEPVNGRVGDSSLPPAGPDRHLNDPLDYRLDSDRRGLDSEAYLDCIRTNFGTTTRFDALVAAVDASTNSLDDPLSPRG